MMLLGTLRILAPCQPAEAEVGMLAVETIGKIRRAFFRQGKSIKAICRELGVSRRS